MRKTKGEITEARATFGGVYGEDLSHNIQRASWPVQPLIYFILFYYFFLGGGGVEYYTITCQKSNFWEVAALIVCMQLEKKSNGAVDI